MSNFENLKEVKSLLSDAKKIGSHNERFMDATKPGNSGNIDKYKKGFNADDRFKSFRAEVYFSSYTGSYGSSSVGSFLDISSTKSVEKAFIKYLQDNEDEVLKGISYNLQEAADALIEKAKGEIAAASEYLRSIEDLDVEA